MILGNFVVLISTLLLVGVNLAEGFETWELDLFDVVEEVNGNFYQIFELEPDCTSGELKKKYRKLSLQWHPDRNQEPEAEQMFRNTVSIYDVLKDPKLRKRYDEVLETGLPNWRSGSYYFRRARKLSPLQLSITLSIIISIGHYFFLWAQHFEKKLTIEEQMNDVRKKVEKKQKKKNFKGSQLEGIDNQMTEFYDSMASPVLRDTLPYRFFMWSVYALIGLPSVIKERWSRKAVVEEVDEEPVVQMNGGNRRRNRKEMNSEHMKLNPESVEKSNIKAAVNSTDSNSIPEEPIQQINKTGWTDQDKNELIKAINKCPAGTQNRWNKIGDMLNRSAADCINMDKQLKSNFSSNNHLNASTWTDTKTVLNRKEEPLPSVNLDENSNIDETMQGKKEVWSQEQQRLLEEALKSIGKDNSNRWERIAEKVPEKSKDECISRFKSLCSSNLKKTQDQKA